MATITTVVRRHVCDVCDNEVTDGQRTYGQRAVSGDVYTTGKHGIGILVHIEPFGAPGESPNESPCVCKSCASFLLRHLAAQLKDEF